jgi:hypothetical protein
MPIGKPTLRLPAAIAPFTFSGRPFTGPMVPSGLMTPVIVAPASVGVPVIAARNDAVINPDADAPSTCPAVSAMYV